MPFFHTFLGITTQYFRNLIVSLEKTLNVRLESAQFLFVFYFIRVQRLLFLVKSTDFHMTFSWKSGLDGLGVIVSGCLDSNIGFLFSNEELLLPGSKVLSQYETTCQMFKIAYGAQSCTSIFILQECHSKRRNVNNFAPCSFCTRCFAHNFSKSLYEYTYAWCVPQSLIQFIKVFEYE